MSTGINEAYPLQHYYTRIYKTYDLVNRLFTFGLDRKWRNITVKECLTDKPSKILDLCCGTGDLAISIVDKATYPVDVTGYDMNAGMLQMAEKKADKSNPHLRFIQGDAGSMPFSDGIFDTITIGFGFRNLIWENPQQHKHLSEISRVLVSGGRLYILESSKPGNSLVRFFYHVYLRTVLVPLGGILSGDWNAYRYLAGSSAGFYTFSELTQLLKPYGLEPQLSRKFLFGSANLLVAHKRET
jgi:demethylmenaquinone methyltransferase/2-methoxy-6-polyprenyl-1,4-benzoquinol methylase